MWEVSGPVLVVRVDTEVVIYETMTSQCGRLVVQILGVRVDMGVVIFEAKTLECGVRLGTEVDALQRISKVQPLVFSVIIGDIFVVNKNLFKTFSSFK